MTGYGHVEMVASRIVVVDPRMSWDRYMRGLAREVGIDDAEEVLRIIFQCDVELITLNGTLIPTKRFNHVDGESSERQELPGRRTLDGPHISDYDG